MRNTAKNTTRRPANPQREEKRRHLNQTARIELLKSINKVGISLTSLVKLNIGSASLNLLGACANLWASATSVAGLGKTGRNALAGTLIMASAAYATIPQDASAHAGLLGQAITLQDIHPACHNKKVWNSSPQIAAFALAHHSHDPVQLHAYRASMVGLDYGVDPRALYAIGHFETGGFRDVMAKETSATNPWQFVDSTKLAYIREHGKNVIPYIEAQKRIQAGSASEIDHKIVGAFNSIMGVNHKKYKAIQTNLKNRDLTGPQLDALRFADIYAGHFLALDIKKKAPELHLTKTENKSTHTVVSTVAKGYYPKDHFLGLTNFSRLEKLARIAPNAKLEDTEYVSKILSLNIALSLRNIADRNPGLLKNKTAFEAFTRITSHFTDRTKNVWKPLETSEKSGKTTFQRCITNPEKRHLTSISASPLRIAYAVVKEKTASYVPAETFNAAENYFLKGWNQISVPRAVDSNDKTPSASDHREDPLAAFMKNNKI